jgi:hypothetical protein
MNALTLKELRESAPLAILGVAVLGLVALSAIGWSPLVGVLSSGGWSRSQIPFLYDSFHGQFALAAGALAIALGFKQSLGDLFGDAQLFVLHRPVSRRTVYVTKLAVGLGPIS